MTKQPFTIHIPQTTLDDLRDRLSRTRWTDEIPGTEWEYGVNRSYLKELMDYWRSEFDWRAQEKMLNTFAHFRADIDGVDVHFIHEHGKGPDPIPLIITHGWPSSFTQMLKIIPLLTDPERYGGDPADAFDVIVPSLPGYGFSDRPVERGMTVSRIASLWTHLMTNELGYKHFMAQGGDIGGGVTQQLALAHADYVSGIHLTDVNYPYFSEKPQNLSEAEQRYVGASMAFLFQEGAYAMIQATKPQTLAYGLNDSPVGLAAWIIEKFRAWSDCDGDIERKFSKDELLTNLTLYWATETINSANRIYYEEMHNPTPQTYDEHSDVPTAVAIFAKDITPAPREWAERTFNVQRWTQMSRGGHFAAMEEPELLVEDIRASFRPLR
ncbi:multidrug MFS transporter [Dictyobacter alpinus]|uniref:Multidrug MFS transporter n=1 Tax=Dictyobacter alpinus TaxID=2014873 RepID=A0A402BCI5_9CHLR|nr:epoxide hydrolase family protein [Dictyobacter alpinus]GCE29054.1 multidrug MFS transporter [Dictyobacter alpinus]